MWRTDSVPLFPLLLAALTIGTARSLICTRRPANTATPKSPVDENYVISITGNPETYILGQEYNVSLNAFNGHRYISFILALENENGDFNYADDLGSFELSDMTESRFSPNCINMVENTNTNPKTHMHLTWVAPSEPGSGCILMRATVLQHRDVWHMDDGGLTRRICEEVVDDVESQPTAPLMDIPCCACDEARYELIFEGVWSRNLHPRDFPARGWETRFCELLGAAHSSDYRFWESGSLASEGLKQYAEHCSSRLLEREFSINFRDQKIRTIIKARGPSFPNMSSKSMASVRVDPLHHMVSFASKIEPSPDWIVGVSGLELCLRNCTWLEGKVINLYPWDVGTDAGPSYTSPDQPQVPPDVIRRMRSDFPNDPRSPFYDETGAPMKPMAILTVRRLRIYERRCADEDSNNPAEVPRECLTHPWSSWSDCSSKCGDGMQYRRRVYKQPELARIYNCNEPQYDERECQGQMCGAQNLMGNVGDFDDLDPGMGMGTGFGTGVGMGGNIRQSSQQRGPECQLSRWGSWSACSVTCGEGYEMRQRQYLNPGAESKCQSVHRMDLQETRKCEGRACLGNLPGSINGDMDMGMSPYEESMGGRGGGGMYGPPSELDANRFEGNSNRGYDGTPINQDRSGLGFSVGNLKGHTPIWGDSSQKSDAVWLPERQTTLNQKPPSYKQPRIQSSYNVAAGFEPITEPPSPWSRQRPSDIYQPSRLEDVERAPWQRQGPGSTHSREFLTSDTDIPGAGTEQEAWPRPNGYRNGDTDPVLSTRCFQMLHTVQPRCQNQTITGQFWFYNFCADECMLYATDPCDRNLNKFSRWEECEKCRLPEFAPLQQHRSNSPECQALRATWYAEERVREEQRATNRRRNYGGQRQRGRN
ncbi:spondin-1 [Drosophila miranda]|uniref:spondin-1 n=1 Tax=Drosophila miranda TaxID=7229 RepID=UPI0007E72B60|nr:spondin-1 [Drosophila miranda]